VEEADLSPVRSWVLDWGYAVNFRESLDLGSRANRPGNKATALLSSA
jgi:hypothetical protein